MAVRSTTSEFQPIPPNYTVAANQYINIGRYALVNSNTRNTSNALRANMSTAPVVANNTQYFRVTGLKG
jgi:hypothetical protein